MWTFTVNKLYLILACLILCKLVETQIQGVAILFFVVCVFIYVLFGQLLHTPNICQQKVVLYIGIQISKKIKVRFFIPNLTWLKINLS